jgi:ribonucleoside-diphosphate reductase alpha chain
MAVWIENRNVLLEKAAVDAIKFTLNNDKSRTNRSDKPAPEVAPVAVEAEMSSEEYRAMIELAKKCRSRRL